MDLNLVLNVSFYIHYQKVVALVNQLLVKWVIDGISVHSILYEKHCQIFNSEASEKSLIFFVWNFFFFVKKQEIFDVDFLTQGCLCGLSPACWLFLCFWLWNMVKYQSFELVFFLRFCFRPFFLTDLGKKCEDLSHTILGLFALTVCLVEPLISIFNELAELRVILFHFAQNLNTSRIFKHLDRHQTLQKSSLTGEETHKKLKNTLC